MDSTTGVIIPAAGSGTRMGSGQVKQLLSLRGRPVLAHTVHRLMMLETVRYLVIPTSPELIQTTRNIASQCLREAGREKDVILDVIHGGDERMDSVKNGLLHLMGSSADVVLIHDAVRPCFPLNAVREAIRLALSNGAAILGIPASDTVKVVRDGQVVSTPERKSVWLAQTPQVFRKDILVDAYKKAEKSGFKATDDASLAEFAGYPVYMVRGSQENIKITYPSDLFFAEKWVQSHSAV
ncbi:2-C-methyl-D-erythritol 4-phosphate cytidylyltransferase [Balneolales bacterium ANBcel1]|nr:2-C-methyl-D-erythritol 4-phosphate cytidylyltransferase [Balneolales bacterium ANBcel1]